MPAPAPQPPPATVPATTQPTQPASITSPPNGPGSAYGTPRSQPVATDSSEMDPAEAQLLGEIRHAQRRSPPKPLPAPAPSAAAPAAALPPTPAVNSAAAPATTNGSAAQLDDFDDGYDTDPPAHYPKAGNGLARTLRPESEDLQWLVDDNFEVFSHGWKGDGSGVGADGALHGL